MSSTFDQLVDRVKSSLMGFLLDQEQYAVLQTSMGPTDTSLQLTSGTANNVSRGFIEIDDELMRVIAVTRPDGLVTLAPAGGRGLFGTAPTSHAANALIIDDPVLPRITIKNAINDTIRSLWPNLYAVQTTNITKLAAVATYALPTGTASVLRVTFSTPGPDGIWQDVRAWRFDPTANTANYASGKSLDVMSPVVPGYSIHVTYTSEPTTLVNNTDNFASVSGLPASCEDLVIYGACYRLVPSLEVARLQQRSVEQSERSINVPAGSALNASKYYLALYTQRLQQETDKLQALYPTVAHYTR